LVKGLLIPHGTKSVETARASVASALDMPATFSLLSLASTANK
jgi:hypothetical protein